MAMRASGTAKTSILILGGWSPGPLVFLQHALQDHCSFYQPRIPMPPVGCSWCYNAGTLALLAVLLVAIWTWHAIDSVVPDRGQLVWVHIAFCVVVLICVRLCVAGIVRGSVAQGVTIAQANLRRHKVDIVIGFSWGGSVVAEMLRKGLVGGPGQAAVVMIAPTTALVAAFALQPDSALTIRLANQSDMASSRVHVFHGTDDKIFCPHNDRWSLTNANTHICHDNHAFCKYASLHAISEVLCELVRYTRIVDAVA